MNRATLSLTLILAFATTMAAQQAFPPSEIGRCEIRTLPAGMLLRASGRGEYFGEANQLFGPLFRYISGHGIAMTTPVEAQIEPGAMFFWVAESERGKVTGSGRGVDVVEVPARRVAALGARGGYTRENFTKTRDALLAWLAARGDVEAAGPAYAVYWNSPFVPWFIKRYEVHVPVRPKTQ